MNGQYNGIKYEIDDSVINAFEFDVEAEIIDALKKKAKVTIYSKDHCVFCVRAKMLLEKKGYDYDEIDAFEDDNRSVLIARVKSITGYEPKTLPQIFIGETYIGGFDALEEHFSKLDG